MGNPGSGKSTLADALGKKLGFPVFHLDREMLFGNFEFHPAEKRQSIHDRLVEGDSWIIDGSYRDLAPRRLERATLVIYIHTSRIFTFGRIIRRYLTNSNLKQSIPGDARNVLTWKYLWWSLKNSSRKRLKELKSLIQFYPNCQLLVLGRGKLDDMVNRAVSALT